MDNASRFRRICLAQIAAGQSAWVVTLRDLALAAITAGKGQLRFMSAGGDGVKNFSANSLLTNLDVADITQNAIDEAAGDVSAGDDGSPVFTYLDHSNQFLT
jgi:hypothetical protein